MSLSEEQKKKLSQLRGKEEVEDEGEEVEDEESGVGGEELEEEEDEVESSDAKLTLNKSEVLKWDVSCPACGEVVESASVLKHVSECNSFLPLFFSIKPKFKVVEGHVKAFSVFAPNSFLIQKGIPSGLEWESKKKLMEWLMSVNAAIFFNVSPKLIW